MSTIPLVTLQRWLRCAEKLAADAEALRSQIQPALEHGAQETLLSIAIGDAWIGASETRRELWLLIGRSPEGDCHGGTKAQSGKANPFHEHLESCAQCRGNPFSLCPEGTRQLKASCVAYISAALA